MGQSIYLAETLPSWNDCNEAVNANNANALQHLIRFVTPYGGEKETQFRSLLAAALMNAYSDGREEGQRDEAAAYEAGLKGEDLSHAVSFIPAAATERVTAMHPALGMPYTPSTDTLQQLKDLNPIRCEQGFGFTVNSWTPTDWACAVAGETGELCNFVKKQHRGDADYTIDIAKEAADVVIYLDLLCGRLGINLSAAIVEKFNAVSEKRGVPHLKMRHADTEPYASRNLPLIVLERRKQLYKRGRSIEQDVVVSEDSQRLGFAAGVLCDNSGIIYEDTCPKRWNLENWSKLISKPYRERLIIAGALVIAELDRLDAVAALPENFCDKNGYPVQYDDVIFNGTHYYRICYNAPTNEAYALSCTAGYLHDLGPEVMQYFTYIGTYRGNEHLFICD